MQNDGVLFGLPVVMDTRDDSVAVGDKILLTYQVRRKPLAQPHTLDDFTVLQVLAAWRAMPADACPRGMLIAPTPLLCSTIAVLTIAGSGPGGVHGGEQVDAQQAAGGEALLRHHQHRAPGGQHDHH